MAEIPERWCRQALIPPSRTSPDAPDSSPIFASLIDEWRGQGKTLPCSYDAEWREIAERDPWPKSA